VDRHKILLVHALDTYQENYGLPLVCSIFQIYIFFWQNNQFLTLFNTTIAYTVSLPHDTLM